MIFFSRISIGQVFLFTGDPVVLRGPFAQIDQPAPLGAERTEGIVVPSRFFFTNRTTNLFSIGIHSALRIRIFI